MHGARVVLLVFVFMQFGCENMSKDHVTLDSQTSDRETSRAVIDLGTAVAHDHASSSGNNQNQVNSDGAIFVKPVAPDSDRNLKPSIDSASASSVTQVTRVDLVDSIESDAVAKVCMVLSDAPPSNLSDLATSRLVKMLKSPASMIKHYDFESSAPLAIIHIGDVDVECHNGVFAIHAARGEVYYWESRQLFAGVTDILVTHAEDGNNELVAREINRAVSK